MAGYNGYSKSNNACDAEDEGRYPATQLARRLGCRPSAIRDLLTPSEWHHTSGWYNRTDYYDEPVLRAVAGGDRRAAVEAAEGVITAPPGDGRPAWMLIREILREQRRLLCRLRRHHKDKPRVERRWTGCAVRWLSWHGSRRRPRCTECHAEGCAVVWKGGATVVIERAGHAPSRKRIGTRGFEVDRADGSPLVRPHCDPRDLEGR